MRGTEWGLQKAITSACLECDRLHWQLYLYKSTWVGYN